MSDTFHQDTEHGSQSLRWITVTPIAWVGDNVVAWLIESETKILGYRQYKDLRFKDEEIPSLPCKYCHRRRKDKHRHKVPVVIYKKVDVDKSIRESNVS